jgi:hypothetical protein
VIGWLHRHELRQFLPEALLLRGRALTATDRVEDAEGALREARSNAEAMGFRRLLWEIDWELGRLAAARGDDAGATELGTEAASVVTGIADTIGEDDLRLSFLSLPKVGAVLDGA